MQDNETTVSELIELVRVFVKERDWHQFHSPKNLSMALSIEASELMEHFQWISMEESRAVKHDTTKLAEVSEEIADVLSYTVAIAGELGIDLASTLEKKMVKNRAKYPVAEFKGRYGNADQTGVKNQEA